MPSLQRYRICYHSNRYCMLNVLLFYGKQNKPQQIEQIQLDFLRQHSCSAAQFRDLSAHVPKSLISTCKKKNISSTELVVNQI